MDRIIKDVMNTPVSQKLDGKDQETINREKSRWFISEECWICNQSRYFIPMFLRSEIKKHNPVKMTLTVE